MAYNASELIDEVQRALQDHPRFTRDMCLEGLNRGIEKLILFASENYDVWETTNPVDPTDSSLYATEFPLPDHLLYLASISFDSVPLKRLTQTQWVNTRPETSPDRRDPIWYYVRGNRYVNLYPRPDKAVTIEVYGLFKPDDLTDDTTSVPVLERQYSDALISYACFWVTKGLPDPMEVARSNQFLALYVGQRAEAKFNLTQNTEHRVSRTH